MADKSINQLNPASTITASDLFVLQQNNEAKSLPGQVLINWITAAADGHGGISNIAKTSTSGLVDTYTITLADTTTKTFTVTNGAKGDKGDTGQAWYIHIRYSEDEPTQNSDMSTLPNNWMGIYSGTSSTAPTAYTSYTWYRIRGDTGSQGIQGVSINTQTVTYQVSTSGTVVPSGTWISSIPTVPQGQYLWTRTITTFSDNRSPLYSYSISRNGMDGAGSVRSVNSISPDTNGNVTLTGEDIRMSGSDLVSITDAINDAGKVETVAGVSVATGTKNVPLTATNLPFSDSDPASTASKITTLQTDTADLDSRLDTIEGTVGTVYQNSGSQASFPASSSLTVVSTLSLPAGTYVVAAFINIAGSANAADQNRIAEARLVQGESGLYQTRSYSTNAGGVSPISIAGIFSFEATTDISLRAFSTTAVSSASNFRIRAVRIA